MSVTLTVHHDVKSYEAETGVPFRRIWFGVDAMRFAEEPPSSPHAASSSNTSSSSSEISLNTSSISDLAAAAASTARAYSYDLGFTGVVRADHTASPSLAFSHLLLPSHVFSRLPSYAPIILATPPPYPSLSFHPVQVRADQTANWRYRIWKQAWPLLGSRGLRLFSGPKYVSSGFQAASLRPCEPPRYQSCRAYRASHV